MDFLERTFYDNTVKTWIMALTVALLSFAVLILLKVLFHGKFKAYAERTTTGLDDFIAELIGRIKFFFLLMFAVFLGSHFLSLPDPMSGAIDKLMVIALLFQSALWGSGLFDCWRERSIRRRKEEDPASAMTFRTLGLLLKVAVWSIALLVALANLGINITALVAGLGIGGIGIALALQNIFSDLFASLSIMVDKPFIVGDFIVVDNFQGTVEHIGLKTTLVRSLSGEQIIFPNNDLIKSRIQNFQRMSERQAVFFIAVDYETPPEKLGAIPGIIRGVIEKQPLARFDRSHLKEFGSLALVFENVYFVASKDYKTYMDIQHGIYLDVVRRFLEEGIKLSFWKPFPTMPSR